MSFVNVGKPVKSQKNAGEYIDWITVLERNFEKNVKSEKETVKKYCLNKSKWSWKVKEKKSLSEGRNLKKHNQLRCLSIYRPIKGRISKKDVGLYVDWIVTLHYINFKMFWSKFGLRWSDCKPRCSKRFEL